MRSLLHDLRMSTTENQFLTLETKGRMLAALRSSKTKSKYGLHNGRWGHYGAERRFTDKQIMEFTGVDQKEYDSLIEQYARSLNHRWVNDSKGKYDWGGVRGRMAQTILDFAKKEGRWPEAADFKDWKNNGLVPRTSANYHGQNTNTLIQWIVDNKFKYLTRALILSIPNVTTRRTAMLKYGVDRLIKAGELLDDEIENYGKLWRLPTDNRVDAHIHFLEVVNSTPEPDGTYAHYFLRVPPTVSTAKEAAAWTFDKDELDIRVAT